MNTMSFSTLEHQFMMQSYPFMVWNENNLFILTKVEIRSGYILTFSEPTYETTLYFLLLLLLTCILWVNNRTSGWQKTVSKVFKNVYGITNFRMNGDGMIEVSGNVDPKLLLKRLSKEGKKAELCWFQFGECSTNLFVNQSDYGRQLGYNGGQLGYYGGQLDGRFLHYGDINNPQLNRRSKKKFQFLDYDSKYECTVAAEARERRRGRVLTAAIADEGVSSCCLM